MRNQVYLSKDFGWFIGEFDNNEEHNHYAIQLSIPLDGSITIQSHEATIETTQAVLMKSNVTHQFISRNRHFLLLINPASTIGHFWNHAFDLDIQQTDIAPVYTIREILSKSINQSSVSDDLNAVIKEYNCQCQSALHQGDARIIEAFTYLDNHIEQIVSLEEIAEFCHLSPSRFLHLFKEETGITYRRAQLWNKIIYALPFFGKKSFTEIAHQVGFSDSAHLSRIFKENFGFSPRDFLKISQFIQV